MSIQYKILDKKVLTSKESKKSAYSYYPFGMPMPNRTYSLSSSSYRFSINGQEKDNEVYGEGNLMTAQYWEYDARIGRRWNVDPRPKTDESPYAVFDNSPLVKTDVMGDSSKFVDEKGQVIIDIKDGKDNKIFVVKKENWDALTKDLIKNIKNDKELNASENKRLGEKYGKDLSKFKYESTGDRSYDDMSELGYNCGYADDCLSINPSVVYNRESGNSELGVAYNMQKNWGRNDKENGKMHRYNPKLKNTPPRVEITDSEIIFTNKKGEKKVLNRTKK